MLARLRPGRRGREWIRANYAQVFEQSPQLHAEVLARIVHGDFVVDHERVTGQPRGTFSAVAIYETRDGLIHRVWFVE